MQALAKSIKSVVVLPFGNYTGDEKLETMVSGMHACLIADIKRLSGLRVINTTTSNAYKEGAFHLQDRREDTWK